MSKWKAPDNAGPSVSVGGATFNIVDGVVELPDEGTYAQALIPFGYENIPTDAKEEAERLAAEEAERLAAEEAEKQKSADEAAAAVAAKKTKK